MAITNCCFLIDQGETKVSRHLTKLIRVDWVSAIMAGCASWHVAAPSRETQAGHIARPRETNFPPMLVVMATALGLLNGVN